MIETYDIKRPLWHNWRLGAGIGFSLVIITLCYLWFLGRPPNDFPVNSPVTIPRGLTAAEIANLLEEHQVVRSELMLYVLLVWFHDPNNIQAGTFVYQERLGVGEVARRLSTAPGAENLLALTLPEGFTAKEFAEITSMSLPNFDTTEFIDLAKEDEGYLFPDTYYIPVDFEEVELYELLRATYDEKTIELQPLMTGHSLSEYGVLILASLLEREANSEESMRLVSGILQKRMSEGMRLQADASLEYVLDRPLNTLRPEDLEIDTPYNTYLYDGLPPTPIGNPGLTAIRAVLDPVMTEYLYYLTDEDGNFHYAETFDEHQENIAKYLQ